MLPGIQHIAGNMIRVALQRDYTSAEKQTIKKQLVELGAKSVRWLDIKQKKVEETKLEAPQHKDLFTAWYGSDKKGHKDLDKKVLFTVHNEVIIEGDELYAVEQAEM